MAKEKAVLNDTVLDCEISEVLHNAFPLQVVAI